ncbi:hypothetical protein GYH30_031420 [Glycine max]|nr:hypothetical protein GYH30_031420 [Glycine max]
MVHVVVLNSTSVLLVASLQSASDLGVARGDKGDEVCVEEFEDSITDVGELSLDLRVVVADGDDMVLVATTFFLLLDRGDDAPRGVACQ